MHIPVLKKQVLEYLDPKPNQNFIDCTIGNGGHSLEILEKIKPEGKVLGIDWEKETIYNLKAKKNLILSCGNFVHLKKIVKSKGFKNISGILFDLGMSTWHLKQSGRGFSFMKDELLDMRYNPKSQELTAMEIINTWPPKAIENILKEFGEEKFAEKITKQIIETRKTESIKTTFKLIETIQKAVPSGYQHQKINCGTRTFQALRIAVNQELSNLKNVLPQALELLKPKGKIIVICFHSLEDRIVKEFFKEKAQKNEIEILTKKPIRPSGQEIKFNPSSRSAKLRAVIKL